MGSLPLLSVMSIPGPDDLEDLLETKSATSWDKLKHNLIQAQERMKRYVD